MQADSEEASVNRAYELADMYDAADDTKIIVRNVVDLFSLYPLCVATAWAHKAWHLVSTVDVALTCASYGAVYVYICLDNR